MSKSVPYKLECQCGLKAEMESYKSAEIYAVSHLSEDGDHIVTCRNYNPDNERSRLPVFVASTNPPLHDPGRQG